MNTLGVRIDNIKKNEILEKVQAFLREPKFHQIATINPEFILEAQKNKEFREILNNCDLNIADSFGLKLAFWRYGKNLKYRMTGADLMMEILKIASESNWGIFLAVNRDGLSSFEETRAAILKKYPNLAIEGANLSKKDILYPIPYSIYGILFCNFGAPYQEIFINNAKNDTISLAMGVGGSFDFLTGKIKRAPIFLRRAGLEWLWRLAQQPKRIKRIWNATVIFSIKILLS